MATLRMSTSTLSLLATSVLAASLTTASFVSPASAERLDLPVYNCMSPGALQQIEDLKRMKAEQEALLAQQEVKLASDQKALQDAYDAKDADTKMAGDGAATWPAGFNPQEDIGKQWETINTLQYEIPVEARNVENTRTLIEQLDAWLRADLLLGPCERPKTGLIGGGPILVGPPIVPPVLVGPPVTSGPPVTVDPPYKPTSGFTNPPVTVDPPKPGVIERFWKWCKAEVGCEDEQEAQRAHNEAVHQAVEERNKARTQVNRDEPSSTSATTPKSRTATLEDRNSKPTATARNQTERVSNASRSAAVRPSNVSQRASFNGAGAATRMAGGHTASFDGMRTAGLGAMHASALGGMHGFGSMHMGGMGGMHMGGMGGMGVMHMGGFGRR